MNIEMLFTSIRTLYESQKQSGWIYSPSLYIYGKSISADIIKEDIEGLKEVAYINEQNSLIDDYKQEGIEIKQFAFKKTAEDICIGYQVFMNEEQPIFDISQRSKLMTYKNYFDSLYMRGIKIVSEDIYNYNQFYNFIHINDTFEIKYSTFNVKDLNHAFSDMSSKNLIIDNCEIYTEAIQTMFMNCCATYISVTNNKFNCNGDAYKMFSYCRSLKKLDLTGNKSFKIRSAYEMFSDCTLLTEIKGLECIDVSRCTVMDYMFSNCKMLSKLDISSWKLDKLKCASKMFEKMLNLSDLYIDKIKASKELKLTDILDGANTQAKVHMKEKINLLDLDIESTEICIVPAKMITTDDYSIPHIRMLYRQFTLNDMQDNEIKKRVLEVINTFERHISSRLIQRTIKVDEEYKKLILNFTSSHNVNSAAIKIDYQTYNCSDEEFIKSYMAKKAIFGSYEVVFDIGACYLVYNLENDKPLIYIREQ